MDATAGPRLANTSPDVAAFRSENAATSGEVLANLRPIVVSIELGLKPSAFAYLAETRRGGHDECEWYDNLQSSGSPRDKHLGRCRILGDSNILAPMGMPGLNIGVIVRDMDRNAFVLDAPGMALLLKRLRSKLINARMT